MLMDAVAMELGITSEAIQVSINRALATSPAIQPCDACARLTNYAGILRDTDATQIAAMVQVFNTALPPGQPPTPEGMASLAEQLQNASVVAQVLDESLSPDVPLTPEMLALAAEQFRARVPEGTQYASMLEFLDDFVADAMAYATILDDELGSPVGADSFAFVMDKYGASLTGADNPNIATFIQSRRENVE